MARYLTLVAPAVFVVMGVISAASYAQGSSTRATTSGDRKGVYLIVHGAWGGGWAFREVDRLLTADGYKVYRPTLTGQGERSHLASPDINLSTHIQDIVNVIEWEDLHDVILVGHSYGGMVITGVADRVPGRIKQLIYVDALLPEDGENANQIRKLSKSQPLNVTEKDGFLVPTWLAPDAPLPHDVPMPARTFSENISLKNQTIARKIPTTYILTVDPGKTPDEDTFYPFYERAKARGWKMMIMEGDHNVQWSRPKQLVQYLEDVTTKTAAVEATPLGAPTAGLPAGKHTYVIVHGAWGGGYAWKTVDEMLSADGHKVYRPTLTGQGEHYNLSSPDITLSTHIQDIVNVILWEDLHDVVLVAHSYGGMVATGVADRVPDRIKHVVYFDSFLPNDGESLNTSRGAGGGGAGAGRGRGRGPATASSNGMRAGMGGNNPNLPLPHDVPQSEKTFSEPVSYKNPATLKLPATYVVNVAPGQQPTAAMFYSFYERAQSRGWKVLTTESDHNIETSHPTEVVKVLEAVP